MPSGIPGYLAVCLFPSFQASYLLYLRWLIYPSATPKALRTSAQPGLTRAISTRLKLSVDPLVYAFDSPGVMLPFLGQGERGAERGVKLALIGQFLNVRLDDLLGLTCFCQNSRYQGGPV